MRYLKGMTRLRSILRHPLRHLVQKRRMDSLERDWASTMAARDRLFVLRTTSRYRAQYDIPSRLPPLPARPEQPAIAPEAWEALYKPRHHLNPDPAVDVVMPITDSYDAVLPTLYRLLSATNETPMRAVLVISRHPDNKLLAKLRRLQELDLFDLLQDSGEEGLISLVNFALQRHEARDAVLLASNADLPDGWLDRLRSVALTPYGSLATASPWTTLGGITGYPDTEGSLATRLGDPHVLDAICASLFDDGITHTLPFPSPYITYIPRNAFSTLGPLPEKPDAIGASLHAWAQAASEKGFEHAFAPRLLIGAQQPHALQKHPTPPDFDPDASFSDLPAHRLQIDHTRLRAGSTQPQLIIHGIPAMDTPSHYDTGALHLSPDPADPSRLRLGLPDARLFPHLSFAIDDPAQELVALCESLGITRIRIRQLAGFPSRMLEYAVLLADRIGAACNVEIADDYLICPGLLGMGKTCAPEDLESGYASFVATHPLDADGQPLWLWRLRASRLFARAESVSFASAELEAHYQRYYHIH